MGGQGLEPHVGVRCNFATELHLGQQTTEKLGPLDQPETFGRLVTVTWRTATILVSFANTYFESLGGIRDPLAKDINHVGDWTLGILTLPSGR